MPRHSETRSLPYTPEQLFDLVADVRPDLLEQVVEIVGEDPFAKAE